MIAFSHRGRGLVERPRGRCFFALSLSFALLALLCSAPLYAIELNKTYKTKHGYRFGPGKNKNFHEVKFTGNWRELLLAVDGFDVDSKDEVSVLLDGNLVGYLRKTKNNASRRSYFSLGALSNETHVLRFQAKGAKLKWGVANVRIDRLLGRPLKLRQMQRRTQRIGYRYGTGEHIGGAVFRFDRSDSDVIFSVSGYDIDRADDVGIYLNGNWIGHLKHGKNRKHKITRIKIRAGQQEDDNSLVLRVKRLGDMWGATNMRLTAVGGSTSTPNANDPDPPQQGGGSQNGGSQGGSSTNVTFNCSGVDVYPSNDLAQTAASYGPGTTFCVRKGTHRPGRIVAKNDQNFICEQGAVLNGAVALTGAWYNDNGLWVYDGAPSAIYGNGLPADGRSDALRYRNDLYIDNQPYRRVYSRQDVHDNGVYFDGKFMYAGTFYQEGNRIFVKPDANGRRVEYGQERWAFFANWGQADRVLIDGCVVEKYASDDIEGAIELKYTRDWTLRNVTARLNHSGGVRTGIGTKIIGGRYIRNGQIGIMGAGNGFGDAKTSRNIVIRDVEVAYNNYQEFDPGWHAGGIKYFNTDNVVITDSRIHHNYGVGVWFDFDGENSVVRNSEISHNSSIGLEIEAVFYGEITGNRIECNSRLARHSLDRVWFWGAAMLTKNSQGFVIKDNTLVVDHGQGMGLVDNTDRGYHPSLGQRRAINNRIENNVVTFTNRARSGYFAGRNGIESDSGAKSAGMDATDPSAGNVIRNNTFRYHDSNFPHWRIDGQAYRAANVPSPWESGSNFNPQSSSALSGLCR